MTPPTSARRKILDRDSTARWRRRLARSGERLVFTNGCFDLLHPGHVRLLEAARAQGDALAVGLNSDESVRRLKGPDRPILGQAERAEIVAALAAVDAVTIFDEDTPAELIALLVPDVLVKGADWAQAGVVGRETVEAAGGVVLLLPLEGGFSSSRIIAATRERTGPLRGGC